MADADAHLKDRLLNDLSSSIDVRQDETLVEAPGARPAIPDHTLLRRIGKGSYGEVWLSRNVMGTPRAVKIVYRRAFDSDRPYEREFTGIRRFEPVSRTHPSQLNVLHVGRDDAAGYFYYVMELADDVTPVFQPANDAPPAAIDSPTGKSALRTAAVPTAKSVLQPDTYIPRTLRSELQQRGALPYDECLAIGTALATALDHLHRNGLVHRDIKPSNIIFVNGIPKLADIGLVTNVEATLSFVGTEGFVPPEGPGTPQADIYSLGKVLYEMATGRDRQEYPELPTNLVARPEAERAALEELNEVVVRACQADPKRRYITAAELHADLALLQSGKSVSRARTVERRLRFLARAGALVTAVAVLAGSGYLYQRHATQRAEKLANENRILAEEKSRLAAEKTVLADENRRRILRLDIANGVRLLDADDDAGALLWFADALPLMSEHAPETTVHRVRLQQVLDRLPRLLQVLPHDSAVTSAAFSPDGSRLATGTLDHRLTVWDRSSGAAIWAKEETNSVAWVRFGRDGQRLFASSCPHYLSIASGPPFPGFFAVLNASSGEDISKPGEMLPNGLDLVWAEFSPDDRWLAASTIGGKVHLFELERGTKVAEFQQEFQEFQGKPWNDLHLAFSPDGSLLTAAGGKVRLWRVPSGEPVGVPLEPRLPAYQALLTDDGRYLLSGSFGPEGSEVQAWELATGKRVGEPITRRTLGIAMFVEPGSASRFFASVGYSSLSAWDIRTGKPVLTNLTTSGVDSWAFSPDGKQLVVGASDEHMSMLKLETGEVRVAPSAMNSRASAIRFSPDGGSLFVGSENGIARLWDLRSAPMQSDRLQFDSPLLRYEVSEVGRRATDWQVDESDSGPRGATERLAVPVRGLRLVDMADLRQVRQLAEEDPRQPVGRVLHGHRGWCWALRPQPTSGITPAAVSLWHDDGHEIRRFELEHPKGLGRGYCGFSSDDRWFVTSGPDGLIRFWRASDGTLERTTPAPSAEGKLVAVSPDARIGVWVRFEPGAAPDTLVLLDLDSGRQVGESRPFTGPLGRAEFSPDGSRLALGDAMGPVTILEIPSGRASAPRIRHSANLHWVEWSPDGRQLLTAGGTSEVLVWDATNGTEPVAVLRMPSVIYMARWSPDGRFIVTRSVARQVRVWDAATGEAVTPLLQHSGDVRTAFITEKNRLVTVSEPDLVRAWDLNSTTLSANVLSDYAKLISGRFLNDNGVILALKPQRLAELCRTLREKAPQLFQ